MSSQAHGAWQDLHNAGAKGLPTEAEINGAVSPHRWSGKLTNGDWSLIKNSDTSFNVGMGA